MNTASGTSFIPSDVKTGNTGRVFGLLAVSDSPLGMAIVRLFRDDGAIAGTLTLKVKQPPANRVKKKANRWRRRDLDHSFHIGNNATAKPFQVF